MFCFVHRVRVFDEKLVLARSENQKSLYYASDLAVSCKAAGNLKIILLQSNRDSKLLKILACSESVIEMREKDENRKNVSTFLRENKTTRLNSSEPCR